MVNINPGKVVIKYQFSELLRQAWGKKTTKKTMTPATILAGFWRCGENPLNLDTIDCSISVSNPEADLERFDSNENSEDQDGDNDKENTEQH